MSTASNKMDANQPAVPPSSQFPPANYADLIEEYTPERIAEFLLNNAVSIRDYQWAREEALRLGVDPDQIPHELPPGA